jgi:hypothetical protein
MGSKFNQVRCKYLGEFFSSNLLTRKDISVYLGNKMHTTASRLLKNLPHIDCKTLGLKDLKKADVF